MPDSKPKKLMNFRLADDLKTALDTICKYRSETKTAALTRLIAAYIAEQSARMDAEQRALETLRKNRRTSEKSFDGRNDQNDLGNDFSRGTNWYDQIVSPDLFFSSR